MKRWYHPILSACIGVEIGVLLSKWMYGISWVDNLLSKIIK